MPADDVTIGDIAIAAETLMREARRRALRQVITCFIYSPTVCCICWVMIMMEDCPAAEMEELEIDLLAQMKIANPYYIDYPIFGMREVE